MFLGSYAQVFDYEHERVIPQSAISAWHFDYVKDEFGDDDKSKPCIHFSSDKPDEATYQILVFPTNGIFFHIPLIKDMYLPDYADINLYLKFSDGTTENMPIRLYHSDAFLTFPSLENHHAMMTYLSNGNFKMSLVFKPQYDGIGPTERIIITIKDETQGIWYAAQKYLENVPGFWDCWGGDIY